MADSKFSYAPIDLATDAIRLVRLAKGSDGDPIKCDLVETFLHQVDGTPYEALSYTWGDPSLLVEITLCEKKTMIRDNLHTALCCLRRSDTDRLLWIDAICIDQENDGEKAHQVGQMRLIYENAQEVHIWLGPSTEDIDLVMELMKKLDRRATKRAEYRRNSTFAWSIEWSYMLQELNTGFNLRRREGWKCLLRRPWFERVWIVQEVFNAKRATVVCGWNTVPTRTFVVMSEFFGLDSVDPHVRAVLEIMPGPLRERSWRSERPTLFALLRKLTATKSSDPRDRIYALMGISSDVGSLGFPSPDYTESVTIEHVIQRTISYLVFGKEDIGCQLPHWTVDELIKFDLADIPKAIMSWALREEKCETISKLLAQTDLDANGSYMEHDDKERDAPLLFVSQTGTCLDVVQDLLEDPRVDVNITSSSSANSPINWAVDREDVNLVVSLMGHKNIDINHEGDKATADSNPPWSRGMSRTPLWSAIEKENLELIALLLGRDDINANCMSCSPLRSAIEKGSLPIITMLLERKDIDVGGWDDDTDLRGYNPIPWRRTPLDTAAESGRLDLVKLLLHHEGAALTKPLSSAIFFAARNGHVTILRELLDRAQKLRPSERLAVLSARGPDEYRTLHCTALHAAARRQASEHTEVVSILLSAGAPVHNRDSENDTALLSSAECGNIMTTKLLLDAKARIEETGRLGRTPLWISCERPRRKMLDLLIDYGANVNAKCPNTGQSALWISCYKGKFEVANALLEAGATIDDYDTSYSCTPLFIAARMRRKAIAEILVRAGAETGAASLRGDSVVFSPDTVRKTFDYISWMVRESKKPTPRVVKHGPAT